MFFSKLSIAVLAIATRVCADVDLLTDINKISRSWGQVSTYADNAENYFGIEYVGLPDGCQIVSTFLVDEKHLLICLGIC